MTNTFIWIAATLRAVALFGAGWIAWQRHLPRVAFLGAVVAALTIAEWTVVTLVDGVPAGLLGLWVADIGLSLVTLLGVALLCPPRVRPDVLSAGPEVLIFEHLFEHSPDGVVLLDDTDHVLRTNATFTRMFGYTAEEVAGRRINDLIVPADLRAEGAEVTGMVATGRSVHLETIRECRDGTRIPVVILGTPIRTMAGGVAVCGIYRDISARRSAELALWQSEETTRTLLDALRDGYCEIDLDLTVLACNPAFCATLGFEESQIVGRSLTTFTDEDNAAKVLHLVRWLRRGGTFAGAAVWDMAHRDGHVVSIEGTVSPRVAGAELIGFHLILRDVTERHAAQHLMHRQWAAIEGSMDGMAIVDLDGDLSYVNQSFADMFGYETPGSLIGQSLRSFYLPEDADTPSGIEDTIVSHGRWYGEAVGLRADSTTFPVEISITRLDDGARTVVVRDASRRRADEQALRESEERYALAARGANDGLWDWTLSSGRMYYSPRWKSMLGYGEHEIESNADEWFDRVHPDDNEILRAKIAAHLAGQSQHFESEHRIRHKDGRYRWMLCRGSALADDDGVVYRMAGSLSDITDRKHVEQRLHHDAFHDDLTQLPNRALVMDRLEHALQRTKRRGDYLFAVLFLDLDRFKVVNDTLGHPVGDQLLSVIAKRLHECVRPQDTVARLGGDEFVILLDGVGGIHDATAIADRIHEKLALPIPLGDHEVATSASIGIALGNNEYERSDQVLRDADLAMYRAKTLGKARHEVFDGAMHENMMARLELETDLRRAVEREEFAVHYQPIVDLDSGDIVAFEALLRWQHPERGFVSPEVFVPVAEETGLVITLGAWMIERACRQMVAWLPYLPSDRNISMQVNLSSRQFRQADLVDRIRSVLRRTGLEPQRLGLEITESVVMNDAASAATILERLRALDVRLQIDDFGTGYSSLSYLHRFPIHALKIDRSFVHGMEDGKNREIVRSIVTLANELQMDVIAEGVETTEQLAELRQMGCGQGQGHYFCQAVPADSPLLVERDIISRVAGIR